MPEAAPKPMTWTEYCRTSDDCFEFFNGEVFNMAPSPGSRHQNIVLALGASLRNLLRDQKCTPFIAPLDVRLSETDVVQPDILIVCDEKKIQDNYIDGAPDVAIEVISPGSLKHDRLRKFNLYARFGVQEYWLVSPQNTLVEIFQLNPHGFYEIKMIFQGREVLNSPLFPDLDIDLAEIFDLEENDS